MKRKFIFHAGPTNSGKTHKALERFQSAKSGIYCGPLRLLASEVYQKTNDNVCKKNCNTEMIYFMAITLNVVVMSHSRKSY